MNAICLTILTDFYFKTVKCSRDLRILSQTSTSSSICRTISSLSWPTCGTWRLASHSSDKSSTNTQIWRLRWGNPSFKNPDWQDWQRTTGPFTWGIYTHTDEQHTVPNLHRPYYFSIKQQNKSGSVAFALRASYRRKTLGRLDSQPRDKKDNTG